MLPNYRHAYKYPVPSLLPNQYKYASDQLELELPLPGRSQHLPFTEKPTRFLNINRKNKQIDYLRSHIMNKVQMEELHYQNKIEQMRRQNEHNRMKLQKMLLDSPAGLFAIPQKYLQDASEISSNMEKLSLQRMMQQKNRYKMMQPVNTDRLSGGKILNANKRLLDDDGQQGDEKNSQQQALQKEQRIKDLNYIYKKNGGTNAVNHFGPEPVLKKQKAQRQEKRQEFEWVQRVRQAMGNRKLMAQDTDNDSSVESQNSERPSQKKKVIVNAQASKNGQEVGSNRNQTQQISINSRQPLIQRQRIPSQHIQIQRRTPSREEDISNMSQYSRYAKRQQSLQKQKGKKPPPNIFQEDEYSNVGLPVTHQYKNKGNWKI